MRDETLAKLERKLLLERARLVGLVLAAVCAVAGAMYVAQSQRQAHGNDALVEERTIAGTVKHWYQVPARAAAGQDVIALTVQLANGRDVQAGSATHTTAHAGDHIELTEKHYRSGRITYVWK